MTNIETILASKDVYTKVLHVWKFHMSYCLEKSREERYINQVHKVEGKSPHVNNGSCNLINWRIEKCESNSDCVLFICVIQNHKLWTVKCSYLALLPRQIDPEQDLSISHCASVFSAAHQNEISPPPPPPPHTLIILLLPNLIPSFLVPSIAYGVHR